MTVLFSCLNQPRDLTLCQVLARAQFSVWDADAPF